MAGVLRGEASAASVFPNVTDIGSSRERIYAEFLRQHVPSKCNVFFGGFIFGDDGSESKQIDVIVTTDTAPRFNFHNPNGEGKSFSPVEGTLAAFSIKSKLDKNTLIDALSGIASIPPTRPLDGRINPLFWIKNYDDWPYKVIYATDGIDERTIFLHMSAFYKRNKDIPRSRMPNLIHVSGKYVWCRVVFGMGKFGSDQKLTKDQPAEGNYICVTENPDLDGIVWVLHHIQENASASNNINFNYGEYINKLHGASK